MRRAAIPLVLVAPVALAILLASCSGKAVAPTAPDAGPTSVTGTVNGVSIPSAHAIAVPDDSSTTAIPPNQFARLTLEIASRPLGCTSAPLPNAAFIGVSLFSLGPDPVGPGEYVIANDSLGNLENLASLAATDATCTQVTPATCTSGSVRIATVSPTFITGSFALAFDTGESMHGTFAADVCATAPPAVTGASCD